MSVTYSTKVSHKIKIEDQETGDIRVYKFHPMSSMYVFSEGTTLAAKLGKIATAYTLGKENGEDLALGTSALFGMMLHAFEETLEPEYKVALAEKVMGKLYCDGELIEDISDHFDDAEIMNDFLEVFLTATWLTFKDFFIKSSILQRKMKPIMEMLQKTDVAELANKFLTGTVSDLSTEPTKDSESK